MPSFAFPERAAKALGRLARWAEWRAHPAGKVIVPDGIDAARGRSVVEALLPRLAAGGWVDEAGCEDLLRAYGVPTAGSRRVRTAEEAATAQAELGGTVAVKIASAIHKSDVGGVALGIETPEAAADAVRAIRSRLAKAGLAEHADEFLVQDQIEDGVEMIVGVVHDPAFGPLAMVGLGGTAVEVLGDVALRLTPLSDVDVEEMLRSLRSYRLLTGYRRSPPLDVGALAEVLHRVSAMVEDIEEIAELDLNPLFVRPHGAVVADVPSGSPRDDRRRILGETDRERAGGPTPAQGARAPPLRTHTRALRIRRCFRRLHEASLARAAKASVLPARSSR